MKRFKTPLIIGIGLAVVVAGVLLFQQVSAEPGCDGKWPCMLYFYTDWCEVCKQMDPIVSGLKEEYSPDFSIVRVDVATGQGKQLANEYGCIGQPAFVLFDQAGEQVRILMGAQSAGTFEREIERILSE